MRIRIKYMMSSSVEALTTTNTEVLHNACIIVCAYFFNVYANNLSLSCSF